MWRPRGRGRARRGRPRPRPTNLATTAERLRLKNFRTKQDWTSTVGVLSSFVPFLFLPDRHFWMDEYRVSQNFLHHSFSIQMGSTVSFFSGGPTTGCLKSPLTHSVPAQLGNKGSPPCFETAASCFPQTVCLESWCTILWIIFIGTVL